MRRHRVALWKQGRNRFSAPRRADEKKFSLRIVGAPAHQTPTNDVSPSIWPGDASKMNMLATDAEAGM